MSAMEKNMDRKEKILSYMKSEFYVPLKFNELMTVLDVPKRDEAELQGILDALVDSGKILLTKKRRYMPANKNTYLVAGRLRCNLRGFFGFLICEEENEEDVFIHGDKMLDALDGDRVLVRIDKKEKNARREGHVVKVTERANKNIVGVVSKKKDGMYRIVPDNRRIYKNVRVLPENMNGAVIGDRVNAEITQYSKNGKLYGKITVILGSCDSLKSLTEGIILSNHIKQEFDPETLEEAQKAPDKVSEKETAKREDLRDKLIFTIDGDDARDFDDAVSLEMLDNGHYLLGVHIADVTHYVRNKSALDKEALERGTSVYLADRVIPMLPQKLSNGICSLNPRVDRLTLSVMMEIDETGKTIGHELKKTVIRSKERMTYSDVTKLLEGEDRALAKKYAHLLPTLKQMEKLARILMEMRDKRGAIGFDFPESYISVDKDGEPVDILPDERGISNKIIEEFMLSANETVAEYAYWSELPFVYRVHDAPSSDKLTAFNEFARHFGLHIKGKIDDGEPIHPKALQAVLDQVKGKAEEKMVSTEMLHSLMKAEYSPDNRGHFGLAAKYYCHFTSPIRRYPDLIIHRILKLFIDGKLTEKKYDAYMASVEEIAKHSSETELNAEHTERDVDELMKTAYMSKFIGESFEASIANVTSFGMFVELKNSVEGLVRLENMNEDYFIYDEVSSSLIGEHGGRIYRIGDKVIVTLVHTDLESRQIDFVLEEDVTPGIYRKFNSDKRDKKQGKKFNTEKKSRRKGGKKYKPAKKKKKK